MKTVHFTSYKVATSLPLDKIAALLKANMKFTWDEYILVAGNQLDAILKYHTEDKAVYLFKYGCISFVNFTDKEIYSFLKYLESITSKINYNLMPKYHESHNISIDEDGSCSLWENSDIRVDYDKNIDHILSIILARSTQMDLFETQLNTLLDEAEKFIILLQKRRLLTFTKKSCTIMAKILRFEFESMSCIRIFEHPSLDKHSIKSNEIYDILADYYEFGDRFNIMQSKIKDLRKIVSLYSSLSYSETEKRLLIFEIFLLSLFSLAHII
ncbi:MAG TPA: RMD1 family protein [Acetivibrio sp.]|uniref:RMD1 family protein n=1 Tax=Acetivibrio sp. TaxID=1872092 RepID=UPI002BC8E8D0|nr:RMD1 family protein [Acetivibrio sp.]HOM03684.1 RMD1 family protein [Acetivibrio sp.]